MLWSRKKEEKKLKTIFANLATCRFGTSAMLSVSANSLVTVENLTLENDRCGPQKLMTKSRAEF